MSGKVYKENNIFIFSKIPSLNTFRPLFCKVPRFRNISQNPTLPKLNNKKVMLNMLTHFIIKNLITCIYSPHSYLMHKTYEHHVVQFIMDNTIIVTIKKVMFNSETNNVSYHINQPCTIPYAPTMYHTLYTNDISYHIH